jgi:hypothetical protein
MSFAFSARAVIVAGGDGTQNTTGSGVSGWDYVGAITSGGASGVYLGDYGGSYWVLTAAHVGAGAFTLDGVTYGLVADSAIQLTDSSGAGVDLLLFRIDADPGLATLELSSATPLGQSVTMIGYGRDRATSQTYWTSSWTETNNQFFGIYKGYKWADTQSKRWGVNTVSGTATVGATSYFTTAFASTNGSAQAATGDSGGGVFLLDGSTVKLAGIMGLVTNFSGQPSGTSVYGNQTYSADISVYRDSILAIVSSSPVPEPASVALVGLGMIALVARSRFKKAPAVLR